MPQDIYAPIKVILAAYQQGVEERQERERLKQQKEIEGERRKVDLEQLKSIDAYRKSQEKLESARNDVAIANLKREAEQQAHEYGVGIKHKGIPEQFRAIIPEQTGLRQESAEYFPGKFLDLSTLPTIGWKERNLQETIADRQLRAKEADATRKAITESLLQNRTDITASQAQAAMERESLRGRVDILQALIAAQSREKAVGGGGIDSLDDVIAPFYRHERTIEDIPSKNKLRIIAEANKQKFFIPTKKWKESSEKLGSTSLYIGLIDNLVNNKFDSAVSIARGLATSASLTQQIGVLGEQFPALGRLSDADIRLLSSGNPSVKGQILGKLFPGAREAWIKEIMKNIKSSYARRVLGQLSSVEWPEEKNRLIKKYNMYVPGMEQYMGVTNATRSNP